MKQMRPKEFEVRNKNLPKTQAILSLAQHDYLITFGSELDKLSVIALINSNEITNLNDLFSYNVINIQEVFPMTRFFLITGMDEGKDIEPYMVETDGGQPYIIQNPPYGDACRNATEIGKIEVIRNLQKGMVLE